MANLLLNADGTLNAVKVTACSTGLFAIGFTAGILTGRSVYRRKVAASYIADYAEEKTGVEVDGDKMLKEIEKSISPAKVSKVETKEAKEAKAEHAGNNKGK